METQQTTNTQPVPPVEPVVSETSKQNNMLVVILSVLLLITLSTTAYFAYQTQSLVKELQGVRKEEEIATKTLESESISPVYTEPNQSPDPTANWKTYTNTQYGFSFKYPTDLGFLYDQLSGGNLLLQNFNGTAPRKELDSDFQFALFVTKYDGTPLFKFSEQWEKELKTGKPIIVEIANKQAVRGFSGQKYNPVPTIWFTDKNNLYTIQLSNPESTNKDWFDQILSTFKFTN
jgi:hypothetical protein